MYPHYITMIVAQLSISLSLSLARAYGAAFTVAFRNFRAKGKTFSRERELSTASTVRNALYVT